MNIINILKPTKKKIQLFAIIFLSILLINIVLNYFNDILSYGSGSFGFPFPFYIDCGFIGDCNAGFKLIPFLLDVTLWYGIAAFIRRGK